MWSEWPWEMMQKSASARLIPKAAEFSIKAGEAPISHRMRVPLYSMKMDRPCSECSAWRQELLAELLAELLQFALQFEQRLAMPLVLVLLAGLLSMRTVNLNITVGAKYAANILSLWYGIHI